MKKIKSIKKLVYIVGLFLINHSLFAQIDISETRSRFILGVNGGVTIGDYDDLYPSNIGLDVVYIYSLSSRFHLGATTGFANYFSDDSELAGEIESLQFVPFTATLRVSPFPNFLGGADIGYAVDLNDGNDGGFYVSPRATYLVKGRYPVFLGYRSIRFDENLESIQFGVGYIFK